MDYNYEKEIQNISKTQDQLIDTILKLLTIAQQLASEIDMIKEKLGLGKIN